MRENVSFTFLVKYWTPSPHPASKIPPDETVRMAENFDFTKYYKNNEDC